jgi:lipoprotein-anchoring transpeptidase ErfK/SrfK
MRVRFRVATLVLLAFLASTFLPMAVPAHAQGSGRWIEVDTSRGVVYAVQDGRVVYTALATVGVPQYPTPKGRFRIFRRVYNETMDSSTIGIPRNAPGGYYLTGVLYTQYFYDGAALHYNYWSPASAFGSAAGSHGCVGLRLSDAAFFWNFATIGTLVIVY